MRDTGGGTHWYIFPLDSKLSRSEITALGVWLQDGKLFVVLLIWSSRENQSKDQTQAFQIRYNEPLVSQWAKYEYFKH